MFKNSIIQWPLSLSLLVCIPFISYLLGCSNTELQSQPPQAPQTDSEKLYLKSQQELMREDYKQAYYDYQKSVSMDQKIANMSHLSSIMYAWAISKGEQEDISLLNKQKQVWLEPNQFALRRELLSLGVDRDKRIIHAFGLGIAPDNITNPDQRSMLARKTAQADAAAWVARLAKWAEAGVDCPFNISAQTLMGMEIHKEFWLDDTIYIVRVAAPVDCLRR